VSIIAIGWIIAKLTISVVQNTEATLLTPLSPVSLAGAVLPLLAAYCAGLLFCIFRRAPADRFGLFTIAFILRITIGLILAYAYHFQDEQILHEWAENVFHYHDEFAIAPGYIKIVAILYLLFGSNLLLPKILNATLGSILPFLIYDIVQTCSPNKSTARRALYLSIFLPPLLLYSSVNLKELPSTFLLLTTIWWLLVPCWPLALRTCFALVTVLVTYFLRSAWALLPLGAIMLYLLLGDSSWQLRRLLSTRRVLVLTAFMGILVFPLRPVVDGMVEYMEQRLWIGAYGSFGTLQTTETSVTRSLLDIERPWALRNIAIQLLRAPFAPLPITPLLNPDIAIIFESLNAMTHYILMPLALIGLLAAWRWNGILMLGFLEMALLVATGLSLMLGLTIQRHIIPHFGIIYILASIGIDNWHRYHWIVLGWLALSIIYIAIYNVVKL
jgi:hypothetical protein